MGEYEQRVVCKSCLLEVPGGIKNLRLAKADHWRDPDICQGRLEMDLGGPTIVGEPLLITFGKEAHYGKIIYQHVELVYQGRGDARTQWRVQFEDGEEYDLSYDEILLGINTFAREPPRDALGNLKRIEIPRDRGEEGRPGALKGRRQQSQDEVDANSETDSDEGDEGLEADGDDNFDQGGDEDAWTEIEGLETVDLDLLDYLQSHVSEGSAVNTLSHIIRTVDARKGGVTNESIIACFERERSAFGAENLPKSWGSVLKKLDVPDLSSACRHMCKNGHYVWGHIPEEVFKEHEGDKCPVCGHSRLEKVRGKLKPVRVLFYLGLKNCIADLFLDREWVAAWKQNMDISINGVYASEHVKLMDEHYGGAVLYENSGLFSMFDDAFTACTNGTNGITLFCIMSHDVGPDIFSREINRRPVMLVSPPEPSNTSLLLDELIKDMNTLAEEGITVTVSGRTFTYKPFMFSWMADAMGRMKILGIGGPGKYVSCSNCWQHSSYLENQTWYPAGYAEPIKVWVEEGGHHLALSAGTV